MGAGACYWPLCSHARRFILAPCLWHASHFPSTSPCCPSGFPHRRKYRRRNPSPRHKKEITMMYKTICLGLLEQYPEIYDRLRQSRTLLPTLNRLAGELKARHQAWMQELRETRSGSDSQIASEAMELALSEL